LWYQCKECKETSTMKDLRENYLKCPNCNYHVRINSKEYFRLIFDGNYETYHDNLRAKDILGFTDLKPYPERLESAIKKTNLNEAITVARGKVNKRPLVIAAMDFNFIGGSMGSVVGEKIALAIDYCIESRTPLLIISKSGGARMMEAAFSLMQMAKTAAKLTQLAKAGIPYFSFLTDPTTGGVTASYAMLGDINFAALPDRASFAKPSNGICRKASSARSFCWIMASWISLWIARICATSCRIYCICLMKKTAYQRRIWRWSRIRDVGCWVLKHRKLTLNHIQKIIAMKHLLPLLMLGLLASCDQPAEQAATETETESTEAQLPAVDAEANLQKLNITLPEASTPVANYVNAVRTGNLLFLAGKGPKDAEGEYITGKVGADLTVEEGYEAARLVAINQLAVLKAELGDLNRVKRVVKVLGMVNCASDFTQQPEVINGFSDLMVEVFGERGKHARAAVGMGSLPRNIAVEIEVIVEVE